jgi:TRAP-type mannitol/chloroaromatic compound transport system permease large subunit
MTQFLIQNMAPIMFAALVVFLLLGYPVAFALAANGVIFGLIGLKLGLFDVTLFQALPQRIWEVVERHAVGGTVLHFHGPDPRAQRNG